MNDIDYLAIDELLTEIYIPIENKSKIYVGITRSYHPEQTSEQRLER